MRGQTEPLRQSPPPAARASPTEGPHLGRILLVGLAAALFLAASGAFGTGGHPFVVRLGYWVLTIGIGAGVGAATSLLFKRLGWLEGPTWRDVGMLTLAIAAPLVLVTWVLTSAVFAQPLTLGELLGIAVPVLIVTLAVTTLNVLADQSFRRSAPTEAAAAPPIASPPIAPPRPRLLDRLPPRLRGAELLALQAEDHYLRLHTTRGSDLILMRLADAVAEADGIAGAQTHRSWWVARDAVEGAARGDGRATLTLKGGLEAPVSRTYAPALREAGWF